MFQSHFNPYVEEELLPLLGIQLPSLLPPNLSREHSQRPLPDKTQYSQETDIHVSTGIQIRNLSRRVAAKPHLRSRCHRER